MFKSVNNGMWYRRSVAEQGVRINKCTFKFVLRKMLILFTEFLESILANLW